MGKMKFLIPGGNGFIGSNFILYLLKKLPKSSIINLDANLSGSNPRNLNDVKNSKNYQFIRGNIKNKKLVDELCKKSDIIINFAAESHVDRSITNPQSFVTTNVLGTSAILYIQKNLSELNLSQLSQQDPLTSHNLLLLVY